MKVVTLLITAGVDVNVKNSVRHEYNMNLTRVLAKEQ